MHSKFFVIWGMHRSGASLLAEAMRVFGAEPYEASQREKDNFQSEDPDLISLNDSMLAEFRLTWQSFGAIREPEAYMLEKAGYLAKAQKYLEKRAETAPLVVLKDPRMARLGAFWKRVFKSLDQKPYSIVAWRAPLAAAASLRQSALKAKAPMPAADIRYGLLLWLIYTQSALVYTTDFPRVLVNYDALLNEPEKTQANISAALDFPASQSLAQNFQEKVVNCKLNHFGEMNIHDELPEKVLNLYNLLNENSKCPEIDAQVWPQTDEEQLLATLVDEANRHLREYSAKMASIHAEICILTGECKRMSTQISELKGGEPHRPFLL